MKNLEVAAIVAGLILVMVVLNFSIFGKLDKTEVSEEEPSEEDTKGVEVIFLEWFEEDELIMVKKEGNPAPYRLGEGLEEDVENLEKQDRIVLKTETSGTGDMSTVVGIEKGE